MTVSTPVRIVEPTDEHSGAITTIDVVHQKIHDKRMFHTEYSASVLNGASQEILLIVGNEEAHITMAINASGQCLVYLYEGADASGGTAIPVYNKNRTDGTAHAPFTAAHTPVVVATGTVALIPGRLISGGTNPTTRVGDDTRTESEWDFDINTKYLLRVTNSAGSSCIINSIIEGYT